MEITCSQNWSCYRRKRLPQRILRNPNLYISKLAVFFFKSKILKPLPNFKGLYKWPDLGIEMAPNNKKRKKKTANLSLLKSQNLVRPAACQVRGHCQRLMALKSRRMLHGQAGRHGSHICFTHRNFVCCVLFSSGKFCRKSIYKCEIKISKVLLIPIWVSRRYPIQSWN